MRVWKMGGAALAGGLLMTGFAGGPAIASPGGWEPGHAEWGETTEDTCDIAGLTVEVVGSGDWSGRTELRGGLPYDQSHGVDTEVFTNLGNDKSATIVSKGNQVALHVTDNGDGTLTVVYLFTSITDAYDDQGDVIAHGAGSLTVRSVWDHAGTISDIGDDVPLSFELLRSSGSDVSTCDDVIAALI